MTPNKNKYIYIKYGVYDNRLSGRYECLTSLNGELSKVGEEMDVVERGAEDKKEWLTEEGKEKIKMRRKMRKMYI